MLGIQYYLFGVVQRELKCSFLNEQTHNAIDDCFCRVCVLSELCGGVYANIYEIKMLFQRCTE